MKPVVMTAAWLCLSAIPCQSNEGWLETRNEWLRVLEWDRLSDTLSCDERLLAREAFAEADERWKASLPAAVEKAETPPAEEPRRPRRRTRRVRETGARPANAGEVMARANAAREAGRLESALRLYRIASTLPGGAPAAVEAAAIEREISGQPAR